MRDPKELLEEGEGLEQAGSLDEALDRYASAASGATEPVVLCEALRRKARVNHKTARWDAALDDVRRAAQIASDENLHDAYAEALNTEAVILQTRGDLDGAAQALDRILSITEDARLRGAALHNLGIISARRGNWELARRRFQQSTKCFQRAGYKRGEAFALNDYGRAALEHGNFAVAAQMLEQAVGVARRMEDVDLLALATMNQAEAIAGLQELDRAEELASDALRYFTQSRNTWRRVECLRLLGDIARRRLRPREAEHRYAEGLTAALDLGAAIEVKQLEERIAALATDAAG